MLFGFYDGFESGADISHAEDAEHQYQYDFEPGDHEVGFAGRLDHAGLHQVDQGDEQAADRQKIIQLAG